MVKLRGGLSDSGMLAMHFRRVGMLATIATALLLGACSLSATGPEPRTGSGAPATVTGLTELMRSAVGGITSAHIDKTATTRSGDLSVSTTVSVDAKLNAGKAVAIDVTQTIPTTADKVRVIMVDGKSYGKLPAAAFPTSKPFVLLSKQSSNEGIRKLAALADSAFAGPASIANVPLTSAAGKSLQVLGNETIDGIPTTHYSTVIDTAKLPADLPGWDRIVHALPEVPMELYVDAQGRPIQVTQNLSNDDQQTLVTLKISRFNEPVAISAPPADQVGTI